MTMGEYQALLRWYSINGTYPSKTLKVALLDASAGRAADGTYLREGAKYYANNLIPQGPAGPVRDVRRDERERDVATPRTTSGRSTSGTTSRTAASARGARSSPTRRRRRTRSTRTRPGCIAANSAAITQFQANLQERGHGRLRPAEREVRRHGAAGEPAPLQRHRLRSGRTEPAAAGRDARRPRVHAGRAGPRTRRCIRPGRRLRRMAASTQDEASIFWNLGHPGLQRRRRPGLEHRREPVPLDGQRRDSLDARCWPTRAAGRPSSSRAVCRRPV